MLVEKFFFLRKRLKFIKDRRRRRRRRRRR